MNVMKSLLLGSAAGIVAVAGAQAADLPVKAKAVEYVKVCSAYGAGFYYIPGTDICLRVGGFVRAEYDFWTAFSAPAIHTGGSGNDHELNSDDSHTRFRARAVVILDARTNTAYGTLRSYAAFGGNWSTARTGAIPGGADQAAYVERAFIQFAGFTFGYTQSFYDWYGSYSLQSVIGLPSAWTTVAAYTAQLGQGVSASISLEDKWLRTGEVTSTSYTGPGNQLTNNSSGGFEMPDIVANIRTQQAWGSAQASVALRQVRANTSLYGENHEYGYAAGGGIELKTPMLGMGDSVQFGAMWTKGAYEYTGIRQSAQFTSSGVGIVNNGNGPVMDLFDAFWRDGSLHLTKAWSAQAGYRHFWTPALRSSINVGYINVEPANAAKDVFHPELKMWQVVFNTIWSPVKNLDIGVDVVYTHLKTSSGCSVTTDQCNSTTNNWGAFNKASDNLLSGFVRVQRNF